MNALNPTLPDYGSATTRLSWDTYRSWLDYLPDRVLRIAYEAVDRHVAHGAASGRRCGGLTGMIRAVLLRRIEQLLRDR